MTTRTERQRRQPVRQTSVRGSTRQTGAELRALGWLYRHPLFALLPLLALARRSAPGVRSVVGYGLGGLVAALRAVVAGAPRPRSTGGPPPASGPAGGGGRRTGAGAGRAAG